MNFFSKLKLISFFIVPLISISVLYHSDSFYLSFDKYINKRIVKYFKINPLKNLNKFSHFFDFKAKINSIINPPNDTDFVNIYIDDSTMLELQNSLKDNTHKNWRVVKLKIDNSLCNVKLKFHGSHGNHYTNNKYSYSLKINSETILFHGMNKFKLIKSEEWDALNLTVNNLANFEGLISSTGRMVVLKINDEVAGEYALVEHHWSKKFLMREFNIDKFSILRNLSGVGSKSAIISGDWHRSAYDMEPEKIEDKSQKDPFFSNALRQYYLMTNMIKSNRVDSIKKYFDINYTAKFFAFQSLFNNFHFTNGDNLQFLFNHQSKQFYLLYRQEHGIINLNNNKDNWRLNTFPNFNNILFYSFPFMEGSPHHKFYMTLLSDNEFRNKRDKHLYELINKSDSIKDYMLSFFSKSDNICSFSSDRSRREYDIKKTKQIQNFETLVKIAKNYLNYSRIYVTWHKNENYISVIADSFSQIKILNRNLACNDTLINGIEFDSDLEWKSKKYILKLKNETGFSPSNLEFYNNVNGSKIEPKKVHINIIE